MKRSDRGRPICRDCDVEINEGETRCAAHNWQINTWLDKSRKALELAKLNEEKKSLFQREAA